MPDAPGFPGPSGTFVQGSSLSASNSQARADCQCRFTVAGELPMARAVSSMVRPPK